jgi:hypothetical protein
MPNLGQEVFVPAVFGEDQLRLERIAVLRFGTPKETKRALLTSGGGPDCERLCCWVSDYHVVISCIEMPIGDVKGERDVTVHQFGLSPGAGGAKNYREASKVKEAL